MELCSKEILTMIFTHKKRFRLCGQDRGKTTTKNDNGDFVPRGRFYEERRGGVLIHAGSSRIVQHPCWPCSISCVQLHRQLCELIALPYCSLSPPPAGSEVDCCPRSKRGHFVKYPRIFLQEHDFSLFYSLVAPL